MCKESDNFCIYVTRNYHFLDDRLYLIVDRFSKKFIRIQVQPKVEEVPHPKLKESDKTKTKKPASK